MTTQNFPHRQSAHCESGVVSSLLRQQGIEMSEAMSFGLSSALSFAYLPIVRINGLPLIAYRMPPRFIINGLRKVLKLPFSFETFRDAERGRQRLDTLLAQGQAVGMQTSVYFLPYFPVNMRFHFNAHNLIAYGKDGDDYLLSDPVFEHTARCSTEALQRARFVRGMLAPKGLLYYLNGKIEMPDLRDLLKPAIRKTCRIMLYTPLPIVGWRGIRLLANKVAKLPVTKDPVYSRRYIGHIVRMQEEIGTGGAGFRYLYAAFLQEAAALLGDSVQVSAALAQCSSALTAIGDEWREFALQAARMSKGRSELNVSALSAQLHALALKEKEFYRALLKAIE